MIVSYAVQNPFSLMDSNLHIIIIIIFYHYFCCPIKNIITKTDVKDLTLMFFGRSFMVSGLIFKFLIHFNLVIVYGIR